MLHAFVFRMNMMFPKVQVNKKVKLCSSSLLFSWQNLTDTVKDQWKCVSHRLDYCDEMDARPNSVFLGVVGMFVLEWESERQMEGMNVKGLESRNIIQKVSGNS